MTFVAGRAEFSAIYGVRADDIRRMVILIISGIHSFFERASKVGNSSIGHFVACSLFGVGFVLKFKTLLLMISLNPLVKSMFLPPYPLFFLLFLPLFLFNLLLQFLLHLESLLLLFLLDYVFFVPSTENRALFL